MDREDKEFFKNLTNVLGKNKGEFLNFVYVLTELEFHTKRLTQLLEEALNC